MVYFIAGAAWFIENTASFIAGMASFIENTGWFIEKDAQFIGKTPWLMILTEEKLRSQFGTIPCQ